MDAERNGHGPVSDGLNGGKGPDGRFLHGNRHGRGNPNNRKQHQLRAALLDAASDEDVRRVGAKLVELSLAGDVAAARTWLEHVCGRAPASVEVSGLDGAALGLDVARLVAVITEALPGERFAEARITLAARLQRLSSEVADAGGSPE